MYVTQQYGDRQLVFDDKVGVSPYAEAWLQPMHVAGIEVPQLAVMVRNDEGEPKFIASHSTGYQLVHNSVVDQTIADLVTRSEYESQHLSTIWNGKKLIERYILPDVIIGQDGDLIALGIEGLNSYDGSTQFGVRFFMHRLVCTNGLYADTRLGSFMFRHIRNGFDIDDALRELSNGVNRFMQMAPFIVKMQQTPIDLDTVINWHKRLRKMSPAWPTSKTGLVIEALGETDGKTMWDLLNAFTAVTTHNTTPFAGPKLSNNVVDIAYRVLN